MQFIRFIALGTQGGESICHWEVIQCFSGWGRVWITTSSWLRDSFPHSWRFFALSRMLNRVLKRFLRWSRRLQHGRYVRLLECWLLWRGIKLRCNSCTMEATIVSLFSASEPLISSLQAQSKELYTFLRWRRSQIARGGTWATWLTSMLSLCFPCWLFNLMFEVMVAPIYRNLRSVYSGCLKFCNGCCASMYIIVGSRDWIV